MQLSAKKIQGMTLLELMIVIAIIGILASIAIPSYQSYTHRAKFSEVIQATAPFKIAVTTCAHEHAGLADCSKAGENGIPAKFTATDAKTAYTASVDIGANGQITATSQQITIGNDSSFTYILTPTYQTNGQLTWAKSGTCATHSLC